MIKHFDSEYDFRLWLVDVKRGLLDGSVVISGIDVTYSLEGGV